MNYRKLLPLLILPVMINSGAAAANVTNVTLELKLNADQIYIDGEQIDSDSYTDTSFDYPYIVSEHPAGIVSYSEPIQISYNNLSKDTFTVVQEKGSFLIPFTEGSYRNIENRQSQVENRNLMNLLDPSFSFFIPENPVVKVVYLFQHKVAKVTGESEDMERLSIRNRLNGKNVTELILKAD